MKVVTKAELRDCPEGTIFRRFEPFVWHGDWMKLQGWSSPNDFIYSDIGPYLLAPGLDSPESCHGAVTISEDTARDGSYDERARYIILEREDLSAFASQIVGNDYKPVIKPFAPWRTKTDIQLYEDKK